MKSLTFWKQKNAESICLHLIWINCHNQLIKSCDSILKPQMHCHTFFANVHIISSTKKSLQNLSWCRVKIEPNWVGNVWCQNFNLQDCLNHSFLFAVPVAVCISLLFQFGLWCMDCLEKILSWIREWGKKAASAFKREQSHECIPERFSIQFNSRVSIHNAAFHCSKQHCDSEYVLI